MRTRAEMEKIIADGGSVLLPDGRRVTKAADLPSEGVLAAGDRDRLIAERDRLSGIVGDHQKQLDDVNRQLKAAENKGDKPPVKSEAKPEVKPVDVKPEAGKPTKE